MAHVLLLELNEISFDYVRAYVARGALPNLAALIEAHGLSETESERKSEELEPWIQWVTAHTGLALTEHGVFRLGDIVKTDIPQVWELLEAEGLRVGAVSPMNAQNRTRQAAFFVPDPWTPTHPTAPFILRRLSGAIAQAVNDNAAARLTTGSVLALLMGAARYARPRNYGRYVALAARRKPWTKAMFLDQLLADVFIGETVRTRPDFASLFLNAGAHIQHHYLFNSAAYEGQLRNPEWYAPPGVDPIAEVYALYDGIVGQVRRAFPAARLMIATALSQEPHGAVTFYWRLRDHAAFLTRIGVPFERVEPRMSRDFVLVCAAERDAAAAERLLASAEDEDSTPLFEVDNRGRDLFVTLTWPRDIPKDFAFRVGNVRYTGLREDVAFVAIKNGEHRSTGYFIDTGREPGELPARFPLAGVYGHVRAAVQRAA